MNPHQDWRPIADRLAKMPPCANCGEAAGNVAFGAAHYDKIFSAGADCPGYEPKKVEADV